MLKKLLIGIAIFMMAIGTVIAQVDVNKADQAALDGIKGIGPAKSKLILEERKKGEFKDWSDFERRVKGVSEKSAVKLSGAGLTVNGKPRGNVVAAPEKKAVVPVAKESAPGAAGKGKVSNAKN